ncbi:polysaccharide deacetylase family protein [Micromonospora coxensis]|uniref:Polysaccharide deacetylase n=1 Tax=Micromonospora coxensis TaxID=356852 RepID=A0A1C5J8V4_9ACTN|nr:polysaccharide deacetylase family protein [Micromonospora coxensis]SCG66995.1 Polysaccharide deacetylase [Micromonospora coxensis]
MNERSSDGVVRRIRAVLVATAVLVLVAAVGVVVTPSRAVAADTAPYRAAVFTKGYDSTKLVTLTFDSDWPTSDDERTRANIASVLDTLAANGITAGFGLTGRFVTQNPDATRAIAAGGHKLINHSWDHPDFLTLTQAARWSQLDRAEAAYRALGLTSAGWFRTPYRSGYLDPG